MGLVQQPSGVMEHRDPKEIGKRVADLRKAAGLSQGALAARIGTTLTTISRTEIGWYETGPSQDTIEKLCAFFKVSEAELLYGASSRRAKPAVHTPPAAVEEFLRQEGTSVSKSVAESLRQIDYSLLRIPSPTVQDVRRVRELIELNLALAKKG